MLLAAVVFVIPTVSFAASLNNDPQDFQTLLVANNTTSPAGSTDQWRSNASANAGEEVSFEIYYHNTGPDTANNVRVKLTPQTTGVGTSHTFTATVVADNAPAVTGSASVSLSSAQSLSFISGMVSWYPDNSNPTVSSALLSGQTGAELFNGNGLNLGNVIPGWSRQGTVIVTYKVSSSQTTGSIPTVTTNNATNLSQTSAALNGYVNPNGTTDTTRWFEWGTSSSNLNNQTTHYTHGTTADGFSTSIWNLAPNTTYYFRAVAQNSQGNAQGQTLSFVTGGNNNNQSQPTVTTQPATNNGNDFAVLNGYVDPNGTSDTTRWFEWGTYSSSMNNQTTRYNQGSTAGSFSASLSGLSQNTTYYYRAVAQNNQGTVYGNIVSFTLGNSCYNNNWYGNCGNGTLTVNTRNADTSGTFAALNGYVDPNGSGDTTHWFEWGTNSSLGQTTPFVSQGSTASSFSATITGLYPNTTYYYRAVARNSTGTVPGSILSFTTTMQSSDNNSGAVPTATTLLPTELTGSSAKLNGLVFTTSNQSSNTWFEWGTNTNLSNRTSTLIAGTLPVVRVADTITGLSSGQTYYYRIAAENNSGRVYGSTLSFVAGGVVSNNDTTVDTTPVRVVRNITVIDRGTGTESLVTLTIDGGDETIAVGEKRVYHVTWKNESAKTLRNVVLRVTFPQAMTVESATRGSFSAADNAVVVDLKTLASAEKGETFIFATAGKDLKLGQLIVVAANMVYTSATGIQGDAIAYVTHRVVAEGFTSGLGANIFGAGSFLPETLLGWMILIILLLALVLLGNHVYGRFGKSK